MSKKRSFRDGVCGSLMAICCRPSCRVATSIITREDQKDWSIGLRCPCGCGETIELLVMPEAQSSWSLSIVTVVPAFAIGLAADWLPITLLDAGRQSGLVRLINRSILKQMSGAPSSSTCSSPVPEHRCEIPALPQSGPARRHLPIRGQGE